MTQNDLTFLPLGVTRVGAGRASEASTVRTSNDCLMPACNRAHRCCLAWLRRLG
jgi:hypothetical protein